MGTAGLCAQPAAERAVELEVAVVTASSSVQIEYPADPAALLDSSVVRKIAVLLASSACPPSSVRPLKVELLGLVVVHLRRTRTPGGHTCASFCAQPVPDHIHPSLFSGY